MILMGITIISLLAAILGWTQIGNAKVTNAILKKEIKELKATYDELANRYTEENKVLMSISEENPTLLLGKEVHFLYNNVHRTGLLLAITPNKTGNHIDENSYSYHVQLPDNKFNGIFGEEVVKVAKVYAFKADVNKKLIDAHNEAIDKLLNEN